MKLRYVLLAFITTTAIAMDDQSPSWLSSQISALKKYIYADIVRRTHRIVPESTNPNENLVCLHLLDRLERRGLYGEIIVHNGSNGVVIYKDATK